jgi:DNA-directed RNA polymerase subunit M/transcription elongation factor TFIIS
MILDCPKCGGKMITAGTSTTGKGIYKRWKCKACGHSLSVNAPDIDSLSPEEIIRRSQGTKRRLPDAAVVAIRNALGSKQAIANEYGVSRELVRQIQAGELYRDLLPEGFQRPPGLNDPSCERCREWRGLESADPCRMGFPDPVVEGVGFARDCSLYQVR